jgi:hypothetical protein
MKTWIEKGKEKEDYIAAIRKSSSRKTLKKKRKEKKRKGKTNLILITRSPTSTLSWLKKPEIDPDP